MCAEHVDAQRGERFRPGFADVRDAGTVIHDRRAQIGERTRDDISIQQIDRAPHNASVCREVRLAAVDVSPCRD